MIKDLTHTNKFFKLFLIAAAGLSLLTLPACSTNPATGEQQFAPFMSPAQEVDIGAREHRKVVQEFGIYQDQPLQNYVSDVGRRVSANTERPDVRYKFFVIDSPVVNAFALPGGYIYVSRGLLALAGSEAELAAVLAHETGHITARHSAERYSRGILASVGAAVLGAAIGSEGATQAAGLGSELYIKSYSRGQENEADSLGIRYLSRAGYDPKAMSWFLASLQADSALQSHMAGNGGGGFSYFSTHPATAERVDNTAREAGQYQEEGAVSREAYLKAIEGMIYGDSPAQGFVRGNDFYHTEIGFGFSAPEGFRLVNQPHQVAAVSEQTKAVVLLDMKGTRQPMDAYDYLTQLWGGNKLRSAERIEINGLPAAAGSFEANLDGTDMTVQLVAIQWRPDTFMRFQIAIPKNASPALVDALKRTTYSFHRLSESEKADIKPYRIRLVTASERDTVASLAARQPFRRYSADRFRVLNGLRPGQEVRPGLTYKIVSDQ